MKQSKALIEIQKHGLPLPGTSEAETKVEYHMKTSHGTLMHTFSTEERAREWASEQLAIHGRNAPNAHLFKVTTITEQL